MIIASWNVNSIRARITHIQDFLKKKSPDVLLIQELKAQDVDMPVNELDNTGYNIIFKGQKGYNAVAIMSKFPMEDITKTLYSNDSSEQARYIDCWINYNKKGLRVASIYLPNGNPINTEKFTYKIEWMKKLKNRLITLLGYEEITIIGGDFNVCPENRDAADPARMKNDALFQPESRMKYREILNLGYTDAWRALNPDATEWTYWDYGRAFEQNRGLRIDHFLLSPLAADNLKGIKVDRYPRSTDKPSDHTPIILEITD